MSFTNRSQRGEAAVRKGGGKGKKEAEGRMGGRRRRGLTIIRTKLRKSFQLVPCDFP
jgi:hypothetical protein